MGLFGFGKPKEMKLCNQCGQEYPKSKTYTIKDGILCDGCMTKLRDRRRNLLATHSYSDITMIMVEDALGKPRPPKVKPTECPICSNAVTDDMLVEIKNGWICKDCYKDAKKKYGADVSKMTSYQIKASSMDKAFKSNDVASKICPVCGKDASSNKKIKDGFVCIDCVHRMRGKYLTSSETIYVNGSTDGSNWEAIRDYKNKTPEIFERDRFDVTEDSLSELVVADFKEQYEKDAAIEKKVLAEYENVSSYEALFYVESVSTAQVSDSLLNAGPIIANKINGKVLLSVLRIKGKIKGNEQIDVIHANSLSQGKVVVAAPCSGDSFELEMATLIGNGSISDHPRGWLVVEPGEYSVGDIVAKRISPSVIS